MKRRSCGAVHGEPRSAPFGPCWPFWPFWPSAVPGLPLTGATVLAVVRLSGGLPVAGRQAVAAVVAAAMPPAGRPGRSGPFGRAGRRRRSRGARSPAPRAGGRVVRGRGGPRSSTPRWSAADGAWRGRRIGGRLRRRRDRRGSGARRRGPRLTRSAGWVGTCWSAATGGGATWPVAALGRPVRARAGGRPRTRGAVVAAFVMVRAAVAPAHEPVWPGRRPGRSSAAGAARQVAGHRYSDVGGSIGPIRRPMIPQARVETRPRRRSGSAVDDVQLARRLVEHDRAVRAADDDVLDARAVLARRGRCPGSTEKAIPSRSGRSLPAIRYGSSWPSRPMPCPVRWKNASP